MTTTEWVERYNLAFEEARIFQDPACRVMARPKPSLQRAVRLLDPFPPNPWSLEGKYYAMSNPYKKCFVAKDWFLNVVGRGDIALVKMPEDFPLPVNGEVVEIDGKERIISSVEVMLDNFGRRTEVGLVCRPIPSNPSPFEPKEVVDDGPVGQNAPEPTEWRANVRGWYMVQGGKVWLEKGQAYYP